MGALTKRIAKQVGTAVGVLALAAGGLGGLVTQAADPAPAGPTRMTLAEAVQVALERQPNITAAHATVRSASIQRDAAYAPSSIVGGPIVNIRRQQADLGVSIAHAGVELAELDTVHAVTRVYLTALYAEEQLKVATDAAANLRVVGDGARTLVNAGSKNVAADDVERIGGYVLLAESRLVEARLGVARAQAALREAVGLGTDCRIIVAGDSLIRYYDSVSKHVASRGGKIDPKLVVCTALLHRPEVIQATLLADISHLEIDAQGKSPHTYSRTFAATADLHSKVLPATDMGSEYRPGPLAPEMPVYLAGTKQARQCRAAALAERSVAVVEKTRGLIALEVEDACLKLTEYGNQVNLLQRAAVAAGKVSNDARRAYVNDMVATDKMLTAQVVEATNKAALNEALHRYTLALAALQKATAGHLWDALPAPVAAVEKLEKPPTAK